MTREVVEGIQYQGEDERIAYNLDVSNYGSSPTSVSVVVKRDGEDVTSTVTTGSVSVAGNVITLPIIHSLVPTAIYRVEVKFTIGGNVLEPYFNIKGQV